MKKIVMTAPLMRKVNLLDLPHPHTDKDVQVNAAKLANDWIIFCKDYKFDLASALSPWDISIDECSDWDEASTLIQSSLVEIHRQFDYAICGGFS